MITKCKKCNVTTDGYLCPLCMQDMEMYIRKMNMKKMNPKIKYEIDPQIMKDFRKKCHEEEKGTLEVLENIIIKYLQED